MICLVKLLTYTIQEILKMHRGRKMIDQYIEESYCDNGLLEIIEDHIYLFDLAIVDDSHC